MWNYMFHGGDGNRIMYGPGRKNGNHMSKEIKYTRHHKGKALNQFEWRRRPR